MTTINEPATRVPLGLLTETTWLTTPTLARQVIDVASRIDPLQAATMTLPSRSKPKRKLGDRIRLIQIGGLMTKYPNWLSAIFGGTSTAQVAEDVAAAARDDSVGAIVILVDSGGGEARGVDDLHLAIRDAAGIKPVVAIIEDLGASAGYYAIAGASRIVANESAMIGSLGTFLVAYDYSVEFERAGVRAIAVTTGGVKGAGAIGTAITPEHIAEFQRVVDAAGTLFLRRVVAGRKLTMDFAKAELFTGKMFSATESRRLRLIDEIGTFDGVVAELRAKIQETQADSVKMAAPVPQQAEQTVDPERERMMREVSEIMAEPVTA